MTTKNFQELLTEELDSLSFLHNDNVNHNKPNLFNPNNIKETTSNVDSNHQNNTNKPFVINSKPNSQQEKVSTKAVPTKAVPIKMPIAKLSATSTDSITKKYGNKTQNDNKKQSPAQVIASVTSDNQLATNNHQQFSPTSTDNSEFYKALQQDGGAAKKGKQSKKPAQNKNQTKKKTMPKAKKVLSPSLNNNIEQNDLYDSDDFLKVIRDEKALGTESDNNDVQFEFHNRLSQSSESLLSDSFAEPVSKKNNKSSISVPFITGSRLMENTISDNSSMTDNSSMSDLSD